MPNDARNKILGDIDDPALEDLYAWAQEVADKVIDGLLFGLQWHVDTIYKILFEDEEAS